MELLLEKNKKTSTVSQPHDKLVKKLLSNSATARDILNLYLPQEILKLTNLEQLELQRDSFIDDEHRVFAVDLLYKTAIQNEEGYIWILLEHQSSSDPWMPVRIFKYIGTIWNHLRTTIKPGKLPFIYPLIIYNGSHRYSNSLNLKEMIYPEASQKLFEDLFNKPFQLVDLSEIQDETLRAYAQRHTKGIALLLTLKHIFDKNLNNVFEKKLLDIYKNLDQSGNRDDLGDMLYYLLNEGNFLNKERFLTLLHEEFSPDVEDKVMTIAQQLKEEGRQEGLEIVAAKLLQEKADAERISMLTGLTLTRIKEIQQRKF